MGIIASDASIRMQLLQESTSDLESDNGCEYCGDSTGSICRRSKI